MKYYISFNNLHSSPGGVFAHADTIDTYREWLEEVVGVEIEDWVWERGDLMANGVYINDSKCATLFRLRFGQ